MNKTFLSKKQADWLIEQIEHDFGNWNGLPIEQFLSDLKRCINQCTEKEFPEFDITMKDNSIISINHHLKKYIKLWTEFREPVLEYDEFLQFTEGCQKICEWIKENDNN